MEKPIEARIGEYKLPAILYKLPAIFFCLSPIGLVMLAGFERFFALLIYIGCVSSIVWFIETKGIGSKIGVGLLTAWYLLFAVLLIVKIIAERFFV